MAARTPRKNAGVGSKVGSVNAPTTRRKPRGTKPRVTKTAAEKQWLLLVIARRPIKPPIE